MCRLFWWLSSLNLHNFTIKCNILCIVLKNKYIWKNRQHLTKNKAGTVWVSYSRIYVRFKSNTWPRVKVNRRGLGVAVWLAPRHDIICGRRRESALTLTRSTGFFFYTSLTLFHRISRSLSAVRNSSSNHFCFITSKPGIEYFPLFI